MVTFIIVFSVILAVIALALLYRLFSVGLFNKRKACASHSNATVISKRMQEVRRGSPTGTVWHNRYYATFDLGNNDTIEMAVNKAFSKRFNVGDKGILFYKGDKFLSFE